MVPNFISVVASRHNGKAAFLENHRDRHVTGHNVVIVVYTIWLFNIAMENHNF